jgi:flagellar basal body-associated protein FliL
MEKIKKISWTLCVVVPVILALIIWPSTSASAQKSPAKKAAETGGSAKFAKKVESLYPNLPQGTDLGRSFGYSAAELSTLSAGANKKAREALAQKQKAVKAMSDRIVASKEPSWFSILNDGNVDIVVHYTTPNTVSEARVAEEAGQPLLAKGIRNGIVSMGRPRTDEHLLKSGETAFFKKIEGCDILWITWRDPVTEAEQIWELIIKTPLSFEQRVREAYRDTGGGGPSEGWKAGKNAWYKSSTQYQEFKREYIRKNGPEPVRPKEFDEVKKDLRNGKATTLWVSSFKKTARDAVESMTYKE